MDNIGMVDGSGDDVVALIINNFKVLVAVNLHNRTGIVKVYQEDNLEMTFELEAHESPMYDMTKGPGDEFFTSGSDCTIRHWIDECGEFVLLDILRGHSEPASRLRFQDNILYSADYTGTVRLWASGNVIGAVGTVEEVWDMQILPPILLTTRHRDVYLTCLKPPTPSGYICWSIKNTLKGCGPLFVPEPSTICIQSRDTYQILIHDLQATGNPLKGTLKGHEAIITCMVGTDELLISSGYDGKVILWDLADKKKTAEYALNPGQYVTALALDDTFADAYKTLFVGGSGGLLLKLRFIFAK